MIDEVRDWGWKVVWVDHTVQEAIVKPDEEGKTYIAQHGLPRMLCSCEIVEREWKKGRGSG